MPKFLITGANGALGSNFVQLLGDKCTGFDRTKLDVTDKKQIFEVLAEIRPEIVINCTAYNAVDQAETDSDQANLINGTAVGWLAEGCNSIGARLVHFSTNYVFSGSNENGYDESSQPDPISKYGESKLLGEQLLQQISDNYLLIRTCWLYGMSESATSKKNFVEIMLEVSKNKTELNLVDDEFGSPTYIPELAKQTMQLITESKPSAIYHVSNFGYTNWLGWANEIFSQTGKSIKLNPIAGESFKRPAERPKFGFLINTKLDNLPGWQKSLAGYLTERTNQ